MPCTRCGADVLDGEGATAPTDRQHSSALTKALFFFRKSFFYMFVNLFKEWI